MCGRVQVRVRPEVRGNERGRQVRCRSQVQVQEEGAEEGDEGPVCVVRPSACAAPASAVCVRRGGLHDGATLIDGVPAPSTFVLSFKSSRTAASCPQRCPA